MAWLETIFDSGIVSLVALTVLWAVTCGLCLIAARPSQTFWRLVPNALSGSCLLAALGLALRQAETQWVALLMAGSLLAYLVDMKTRLTSGLLDVKPPD